MLENKPKRPEMTGQIREELKELTTSISKMMQVFKQIRKPIQESFEKVPTTTQHLEKVTEQTEAATHRVLDMVEAITNRESDISQWIKEVREMVAKDTSGSTDNLNQMLEKISAYAEANLNDSYSIMDALQFQDITSQQMDHAITLLDEVENKLMSLLSTVGVKNANGSPKEDKKKRVYDPNASFVVDEDKKQQNEIDNIISNLD